MDQFAGCKRGDLLTLMLELQMAVGNVEQLDSSKLYLDFMQASLRASGENSLLKFIAYLKQTQARLATTTNPISDQLAQDVLKRGLHELFEPWSIAADGTKFASFREMEVSLKRYATRSIVAAKLQALMPTNSRASSVTITVAGELTP